jgi:UDP-N-acetylglucosamine 2-epimerase (non-hydrolysing)
MIRVLVILGTRPEAVKLAPVIRALQAEPGFDPVVCVTGQHRQMLDQMLGFFGIVADHDLDVMTEGQTLTGLAARMMDRIPKVIETVQPEWVVVQGDTTTAMTAGLAAFYAGVKVAHVEAGLRTGDRFAPFPEEVNRKVIAAFADLHLAPTPAARAALLAENVAEADIRLTGNTGIDSLLWAAERVRAEPASWPGLDGKRLVLVTAHRRESYDGGFAEIAGAIEDIVRTFDDVAVVLPVHPNPKVRSPLEAALTGVERVLLVPPLDYPQFVGLLDRAALVLTDSGGVQEEAATLGKPMLVLRDVTERPEAIAAGAILTGAHRGAIVREASRLLADSRALAALSRPTDVFGDGRAAERVVAALAGA